MVADAKTDTYRLNPGQVKAEFIQLMPIAVFVTVFGIAFGLAAGQAGLLPWQAGLMSVTVFAGAAQFAALGPWGQEVSLIPLVAIVLAINSRQPGPPNHQKTHLLFPTFSRFSKCTWFHDQNWKT